MRTAVSLCPALLLLALPLAAAAETVQVETSDQKPITIHSIDGEKLAGGARKAETLEYDGAGERFRVVLTTGEERFAAILGVSFGATKAIVELAGDPRGTPGLRTTPVTEAPRFGSPRPGYSRPGRSVRPSPPVIIRRRGGG